MSIDVIINDIEKIVNKLMESHPAVVRVVIADYQGMKIAQKYKEFDYVEGEEKSPNPSVPLLNSILENAEKFLGFMKEKPDDVFIFTWLFEKQYIFGASSPFGFIGMYCEPDVDIGWVKLVLKEQAKIYNQIMKPVFI